VRVAGRWTYLYRAVDSTGATIDFFLSETRDLSAALTFFRKALAAPGHPRPRVINVDGNRSYPTVIEELKRNHALGQRCRCRVVPYLNNVVEIVFTQMTKTSAFTPRVGWNHIPDLHFIVDHQHSVNQQFNQSSLLLKCDLG
jgi:transposase-like protein